MKTFRLLTAGLLAVGGAVIVTVSLAGTGEGQGSSQTVAIDADDIGGIVSGPKGPEAGVWVIAETTELPTKFAKIVVTDERGRYVVPDLPEGHLQRLGSRLRSRRLGEDAGDSRQDART